MNDVYRVKSAASFPWQGSLIATQQALTQVFLGVSAQRWDGNYIAFGLMDGKIRIDTHGVYEFDCDPEQVFQIGQFVGLAGAMGRNFLLPQYVVPVTQPYLAIGWVERLKLPTILSHSTVFVRLFDRSTGYNIGANLLPTTTTSTTSTSTTTTTTTTTP